MQASETYTKFKRIRQTEKCGANDERNRRDQEYKLRHLLFFKKISKK